MSPNRRIIVNIVATYGRSLLALVCGLFTSRWILMFLGEVDFGLYGVVGGLAAFIGFINSLMASAVGRYYAYYVGRACKSGDGGLEDCRRWFNTAVFIHTVIPIALVAIGYPVGDYAVRHWLTIPAERILPCVWVFRFVCASCFVAMVNVPFHAMYTAKQYIAELTIYSFCTTVINTIAMYYMVSHPGDWLVKYALWMAMVSIAPQLIICWRSFAIFPECKIRIHYLWSPSRMKELGAYAFYMMFGMLGTLMRVQGIQVLVNKYFGPVYNASFSVGSLVNTQSQTLASALSGAFQPAIVTACGAKDFSLMRALAYRTGKFGVMLWMIFLVPLVVELPYVLKLWLVNPPPCSVGLCYAFILVSIINKITMGHYIVIMAIGDVARFQMVFGSVLISTILIAWSFFHFGFSVYSAGFSLVLTMVICAGGRLLFTRAKAGMSIRYWFLRVAGPIAISAVVAVGGACIVRELMDESFVRLVAVGIIGEILFLPLAWWVILDGDERNYVIAAIQKRLKRKENNEQD